MSITEYVLGFAIDENRHVAMVKKRHGPTINVGRWNGIGGKIDPTDVSPRLAMIREFYEETGITANFVHIGSFNGPDWRVFLFRTDIDCQSAILPHKNDVGESLSWWTIPTILLSAKQEMFAKNIPTVVAHIDGGVSQINIEIEP